MKGALELRRHFRHPRGFTFVLRNTIAFAVGVDVQAVVIVPGDRLDTLWLDNNFAMNYGQWTQLDVDVAFPPQNLGGIFTSPPAGVSLGSDRLDVFGLGLDYNVYHKTYDAAAKQWTPEWENLGGNFTCTPVVISTSSTTIDLFGLGPDQSMLHRTYDGKNWSDWEELGGSFTSPPAVLPGSNGSFDIFGRGLDFKIYMASWTPGTVPAWQLLGGGLLGAPTVASSPAAVRVRNATFVFVTGDDSAVWMTAFDGVIWKPWTSLGPAQTTVTDPTVVDLKTPPVVIPFVSEPVVCAFYATKDLPTPVVEGGLGAQQQLVADAPTDAPNTPVDLSSARIDVFAVGKDNALWHKWFDYEGWHGASPPPGAGPNSLSNAPLNWIRVEKQVLGAPAGQGLVATSCACAPSLYASTTTALFLRPPPFIVFVEPTVLGTFTVMTYDGKTFDATVPGPTFRIPSTFKFSLDSFLIANPRSAGNDTDYVTVTLSVGKWPIKKISDGPYDGIKGINYTIPFPLETLAMELCEPVFFTYTIVNTGDQSIGTAVQSAIVSGAESLVSASLTKLATPMPHAIAFNGLSLQPNYVGTAILGVAPGAIIGAVGELVVGSLLTYALSFAFADCDGVVVVDQQGFQKARDLQQLFAGLGTAGTYRQTTRFLGSDSPKGCFSNSDYTVQWSIARPLP
jgi:hypothetical protein